MGGKVSSDGKKRRITVQDGTRIDHFVVLRRIGQDGTGQVFLARDTRLGRKVALKLLRTETLGSFDEMEAFIKEARITARFNHPNIVTIHDVLKWKERPYLVMEYLQGQTLHRRLSRGRFSPKETVRIGISIASALKEAHAHKILHRDLKPDNVIIPPDGRLRVLDFGLARLGTRDREELARDGDSQRQQAMLDGAASGIGLDGTETPRGNVRGTPIFMAPEQWCRGELTAATDVWALGMSMYQMLLGRHPWEGLSNREIGLLTTSDDPLIPVVEEAPEELTQLIGRCLKKDPQRRPTVDRLIVALEDFLVLEGQESPADLRPFRGLLPFDERHQNRFFGREAEVDIFLEKLRQAPVLPVIGPSGAGKSSFVQAGIVPRLREQGRWTVLQMRPGDQPLHELADLVLSFRGGGTTLSPSVNQALGLPTETAAAFDEERATGRRAELALEIARSPATLGLKLTEIADREICKVLLFVDQLEELFTLSGDDRTQQLFLEALCCAADDPMGHVRVAFTLRADFLGKLALSPASRQALNDVTLLGCPAPESLEQILTRPLETAGYRYDDPELVAEMVAAVRGDDAALPLLQFVGQVLWSRRDREKKLLTRAVYEEVGGVTGALARHADALMDSLPPEQMRVAKHIFLRLVTPDGGRRVVRRSKLVEGLGEQAQEVVDRLVKERAILVRQMRLGDNTDPGGVHADLELIHESLIRTWDRFGRWRDENREELVFIAEAEQAAELWAQRGRRDEELWSGDALHDALRFLGRIGSTAPTSVIDFLQRGDGLEQQRRRKRRDSLIVAATLLVAVVLIMTVLTFDARRQRGVAVAQRHQADIRQADALREASHSAIERGDLLEARSQLRQSLELQDSPLARALWWELETRNLRWSRNLGSVLYALDFAPDGRRIAVAAQDCNIYVFDTLTGQPVVLRGHRDQTHKVKISPDGRYVLSGTWSGQAGLWDLENGTSKLWQAHEDYVNSTVFSPDGERFATSSRDGSIRLWSTAGQEQLQVMDVSSGTIYMMVFSGDGKQLMSASGDGTVRIWDTDSGDEVRRLEGHTDRVTRVVISPDGTRIASAGRDRTVRLWDAATGRELAVFEGHTDRILSLRFFPDGRRLVSASWDNTLRIWDVSNGDQLLVYRGHNDKLRRVELSNDGQRAISAGLGPDIHVWDTTTGETIRTLEGHTSIIAHFKQSPDGRQLASVSYDLTVKLWDLDAGQESVVSRGHRQATWGVDFSPDGQQLITGGMDGALKLWDVASGRQIKSYEGFGREHAAARSGPDFPVVATTGRLKRSVLLWDVHEGTPLREMYGHDGTIFDIVFSPDGQNIASTGWGGEVLVWDTDTGVETLSIPTEQHSVVALDYSDDGRWIATAGRNKTVKVWNAATGRLRHNLTGHTDETRGVAFSPDGSLLASSSADGTLRLWDMGTGEGRVLGEHDGRVYWIDFHPDGRRIGAPTSDGTATIWDRVSGDKVVLRGHQTEVNRLTFSPDGKLATTSSDDGSVRLWYADSGQPYWRGPAMLGSAPDVLTHLGWQREETAGGTTSSSSWRDAVQGAARLARSSKDEELVCLWTRANTLEIWDTIQDKQLDANSVTELSDLMAIPGGCALLGQNGDVIIRKPAAVDILVQQGATALTWHDGEVLVASGRDILAFDAVGQNTGRYPADVGVTSIALIDEQLLLGYRDGSVEITTRGGGTHPDVSLNLENTPSSPVMTLLPGPMGTFFAGYGNGVVGAWSVVSGTNLFQTKLHGSVVHLQLHDNTLHALTEMGDYQSLDLGVFYLNYCELLREVWEDVPTVWIDGQPTLQTRDPDHDCQP